MRVTRRDALKLAGAGAIALTAPEAALAAAGTGRDPSLYPAEIAPWPILQGPTDHRSASFIFLLPRDLELAVQVVDGDGHEKPWRPVARFDLPQSTLSTHEIVVTGLRPGEDYTLYLLAGGGYFDRRIFRALDVTRSRLRFGALSCMNDIFRHDAIVMWEALAREQCDFVILNGDTCYADQDNPLLDDAGYAWRYAKTRSILSWFKLERLVPTFAVWDDHDFGVNNGDRRFAQSFMRQLFRAFWGSSDNAIWHKGLGVGSRIEAFGQRFYILDGRSFRDPNKTPDGRHWGAEQLDWLFQSIGRDPTPAWVVTGNQFFGDRPINESVEVDHPADLQRIMAGLAQRPAPVALISGDVHYSEIRAVDPSWLGYETYQFTSSSMHSLPNVGVIHQDNLVAERSHNFMVIDTDRDAGWRMRCRCILEDNVVSFDRSFAITR
jgi:phosphodiesterase/alkaline phosphatase D-like protein